MKDGKRDLVVVITGGTAGVRRATARRFAKAGSRVAILARGQDGLYAAGQELQRLGAAAVAAIACDVADPAQVFDAAQRIERELGPIDIWINNAMTTVFGRFRSLTPGQCERVTRVKVRRLDWLALWPRTRSIEHASIGDRATELDVLRMCPSERRCRAGRLTPIQVATWNAVSVPDLLGQHAGLARAVLENVEQLDRGAAVAPSELVVRAFSDQQRPWPADAVAIEWSPVGVLTVSIAGIATPARPLRQLDPEHGIDHLHRVANAAVVRVAQPEPDQRERVCAHFGRR
ncbi:MAG TPA: SDR family NAD(P)-dependent oxidoreductase [Kofleriaceae bacterium]|jgi:NAD(P)-dependent dehydrogenase (short-subunit alcohol dehydrogenase family)